MNGIIPLVATIVSIALTFSLGKQYLERRKMHQLLYSISLLMFSIAAFGEFYADAFGFSEMMYKVYYYPAITLVPIMGAGTVYLLVKERKWIAHLFLGYVILLSAWLFILIIPAEPITAVFLGQGSAIGGEAMPDYIRRFSFPLSGIGGIVLLFGALFSYWKTKFKGNLYIAISAFVMMIGGRLATMGLTMLLPLSELIGIILLYYGVVIHPASMKTQTTYYSQKNS